MERRADIRSGEAIGRVIADIRRARGLTQSGLAERSGVTRTYLSHIETGRTSRLLEVLLRTLRALDARVYIVFDDEVTNHPS